MGLSAGHRLGPYEILAPLGAGGMGEVYDARDPRLGRRVAVKVLRSGMAADPDRLARFEREGRAVAALNHPNILTVHDVGVHEGTPYVVTELLEGESLREVASKRLPTQRQVLGWAVQTAQGLSAAHQKGIVHRDLKPENLFRTTDGRIKILDFGLAKLSGPAATDSEEMTASSPTGPGVVMGTVAYMSPEQVEGRPVDARSDLFSFGVVLYELLGRRNPFRRETAGATLGAILRETPAPLTAVDPSIPRAVDGIVARCLAKEPDERFQGAHDLGLALEAVLAAPTGSVVLDEVEERSPYPGIASFTEKEASLFYGREAEVRSLWERIRSRPLLAVIGPSGAGKTSFLRAGVIPARPEGWAAIAATPGASPFRGLGQALAPELVTDADAVRQLVNVDDPETAFQLVLRWRRSHGEALVIVDQFEELFTLNSAEVQARFAALLARLVEEAGVHVVLSLRDDFLMRCHEQPPLAPVFRELTPLGPLTADGLQRALVEPAKKRGYRFEDDALVDDMVGVVEGERGALPLLAFAVSRLWEKRNRERKLLSREAYAETGGVAGALARHAEATIDRVGSGREAVVREIFRNLVTAQGTRAVMDREEVLSAFPDRAGAEEVVRQLVDARLLVSYQVEVGPVGPHRDRIEIVHESLLRAWPRLVRWQAQDEEGAVLRDQLRQASRLWEEKGRSRDLLWTGTAYQEFELWRGRYPGALSSLEEQFAKAMADKARRTKRLVRAAAAAVVVALTGVIIAVSVSRYQAVVAARRAEAAKLLAIGQERLALDPTVALAYATASIEVADSPDARLFALRALWEAPPALELVKGTPVFLPAFSPDGRLLATGGYMSDAHVFREEGGPPAVLKGHWGRPYWASNDRFLLLEDSRRVSVWSLPAVRLERTIELGGPRWVRPFGSTLLAATFKRDEPAVVLSYPISGGDPVEVFRRPPGAIPENRDFAPGGASLLFPKGSTLLEIPFAASRGKAATVLGEQLPEIQDFHIFGNEVLTYNRAKQARLFTFEPGKTTRVEDFALPEDVKPPFWLWGGYFFQKAAQAFRLWKRDAWSAARPLSLRRDLAWYAAQPSMHPAGDWLVACTEGYTRLTFWPLKKPRPFVVDGFTGQHRLMAFSRDGRWLATSWPGGPIRLWPLTPGSTAPRTLAVPGFLGIPTALAFDPGGRFVFCVGQISLWVVPVDGRPPVELKGFTRVPWINGAAVSPSGRSVAAAYGTGQGDKALRVWDLETGATRAFDLAPPAGPGGIDSLAFAGESTIYSSSWDGVRSWDLASGRHEVVVSPAPGATVQAVGMAIAPDQGVAVVGWGSATDPDANVSVAVHDLARQTSRPLPEFGTRVLSADLDPSGRVLVTVDRDGIVRVGRLSGGEPHLLVGHRGGGGGGMGASGLVSPDLKWIASAGEDNTLRLWPMPDLDKPPLHTLPQEELLAKLRSLTNLRAVRDAKAATGWKIDVGPFPGWKDAPAWEP